MWVRIPPWAPIKGNSMKFVIQDNLINADHLEQTRLAIQNYPHLFVGVIPFSHEITSNEPLEGVDYIPYGSTLMTNITKELGWKGLHFDLSQFNYEAATRNRSDMLNAGLVIDLSDAIEMLHKQPADEMWFVRPSEDLKQFSGQVMEAKECADWMEDAMKCESSGSYKLDADTRIVLARPQNIFAEWRWFVVGGKVVSGSMYRRVGQLYKSRELDDKAIREAQTIADEWLPDPCCVMDLALTEDGVKVIEFNCINSSGFYDNDIAAVFKSLYEYHVGE